MNFYLAIVAFLLFVLITQWFLKLRAKRKLYKDIPGPLGWILFGNIWWVIKLYSRQMQYHPGVYVMERVLGSSLLYPKSGVYSFFIGTSPMVSVFKPDIMELVLSSNVSLEKSYEYSFLHKWLGLGLLTSTGSKWKSRRKLLTPSFHFRILDDFLPSFNEQSKILVKKLLSSVDKEYVDVTPLIIQCTLDIVCETVMGCHVGAQMGENSEYVSAIHNLADFFNRRTITPWLWWDFTFSLSSSGRGFAKDLYTLHSFTKRVIKEKKVSILEKSEKKEIPSKDDEGEIKKRKALMDLLLDLHINNEQITEEGIQEEVDTFMFEGHDTTAMGIIYSLYCIGLYPDVQRKAHDEVDAIFGENTETEITMKDVRSMKYLECVLKESQRLFPSVPLIGRKLNEDIHYNNMTIPKGTTIHCNIMSLHRNPDQFPNPEIFDPDRFLPENSLKRHPYTYVPFSAGPRNCIGQKFAMLEEKVIVANILRNFKLDSLDLRDKVHLKIEFTLRPAQPMRVRFSSRR